MFNVKTIIMKNICLGALLILSNAVFGQDSIPIIDGKYKYVKIIEVDSANKTELYKIIYTL